ncbi:lipoyl protein ligase domain-containing protein [Streptomyces sp. 372A]
MSFVEVGRGGHATYHGPGQLVGHLVLHVRELGPCCPTRRIERALIRAAESLGTLRGVPVYTQERP